MFARIEAGRLDLTESWSGRHFAFGPSVAGMQASLAIHDPDFYNRISRQASIGLGSSYADGMWDTSNLVELLRIAAREITRVDSPRRMVRRVTKPLRRLRSDLLRNTIVGARRNISAHYDLGNEMFELFLDRDAMMYSSGLYEREDDSLEAAQRAKLDRICELLELGPDKHLLEIGTGWGGLALHAASNYGCRVTTTTISKEQREYAQARIARAGLGDRITVLDQDYRMLTGQYDRLVSIEMIEAIGWQYMETYFSSCSKLLKPDGLMFLQAICMDDRNYETEKDAATFSNTLIFPGGFLPSVEAIARTLRGATDLRTVWLEDISASYALTLKAWRERFLAAEAQVEQLGYDRRFRRLWEFYLAIAQAGFSEARIMDVQILCAKPDWRGRLKQSHQALSSVS